MSFDVPHEVEHRWPELFTSLTAQQRRAVRAALSTQAGPPSTRAEMRVVVEFAAGRMSAQEYARHISQFLGITRFEKPAAPRVLETTGGPRAERRSVVDDYLSGRISADRFLGISTASY